MKMRQIEELSTITNYRHCIVMAASETEASSMILSHHAGAAHFIIVNSETS
jgi:hypothetical protein